MVKFHSKREEPVPEKLYDEDYYQKYNHGYDEFVKSMSLMLELEIFLKANIKNGDQVLDVGCGRGTAILFCRELGAKCIGIDYSKAAIKIAKESLKDYLSGLAISKQVKVMNSRDLKFKEGSFDVVIMLDVVEHLHSWELKKTLNEAHRVLKKGGRLLIHTTPNKNNMKIFRAIAHLFGTKLTSESFHVNEQSPSGLSDLLRSIFPKIDMKLEKVVDYFTKQTRERGSVVRFLARAVDAIYDSRLMRLVMKISYLNEFLATGIFVVARK